MQGFLQSSNNKQKSHFAAAAMCAPMHRSKLCCTQAAWVLASLLPTCIWARAPLLAGMSSKDASEPASLSASV